MDAVAHEPAAVVAAELVPVEEVRVLVLRHVRGEPSVDLVLCARSFARVALSATLPGSAEWARALIPGMRGCSPCAPARLAPSVITTAANAVTRMIPRRSTRRRIAPRSVLSRAR